METNVCEIIVPNKSLFLSIKAPRAHLIIEITIISTIKPALGKKCKLEASLCFMVYALIVFPLLYS